ncbi:putative DNA binding domain-containing protein [Solibacillus sp. A46]|uniref:DNA binding domain-containing protein n=1 Tax=Solibacillus faecavium TaxID=2762221 RepID=A0ABR8XXT3_9BACL|nr:RNA-binding domain-containing protein [Solibacillus faecavium]MBD8036654.1 putative DNA binding domain-containing protein [Solibacillus faecavium]
MKMKESPTLQFKRELTDAIKREIIAFANTQGGELYIGVDDDGSIIGLENADKVLESVSSMLHDSIQPDILVHAFLEIVNLEGKNVVKISVARGTRRPYHLKAKGMKPSGVFIRYGTSVTNASEENIRQMIIESDGTNFETMRSLQQELTFTEAKRIFDEQNLKFGPEKMRTLGLITEDGYYTNLGLLFSDQCEHTIKCARYLGNDKIEFQDRKEFSGSILKQVEAVYEYLSINNAKHAHFEGLKRIETETYPSYALREALINAFTHRDYSFSGSILIHLFQDRLELVSVGGLVKGLTLEDIELGISQSRNPKLANVLYRLKWIESYGTGLQRMRESYKGSVMEPYWTVGPNAFVVTLPKYISLTPTDENEALSNWLAQSKEFTARDLENYLKKSKATVRKILEELIQSGQIMRVGSGPKTKYQVLSNYE